MAEIRNDQAENICYMVCKECGYEMTKYQAINSYKGLCVCCYD